MLASILDPTSAVAIVLQVIIILSALLLGTRYGGLGLGLISGIGLIIMVFVFGLVPGEPPSGRDADHYRRHRLCRNPPTSQRSRGDDAIRREIPPRAP